MRGSARVVITLDLIAGFEEAAPILKLAQEQSSLEVTMSRRGEGGSIELVIETTDQAWRLSALTVFLASIESLGVGADPDEYAASLAEGVKNILARVKAPSPQAPTESIVRQAHRRRSAGR